MADNWANWYTGGMSPPNKLPDGSYQAAPIVSTPMSVDEMYRGIYAAPQSGGDLTTRSVRTVQIDPYTGQPVTSAPKATASGSANSALGAIANATGSLRTAPVYQPSGSINAYKTQDRLQAQAPGMSVGGSWYSVPEADRLFPQPTSLKGFGYGSGKPAAQPAQPLTFPLAGGGSLTGSGTPNYGNYRATMRMANPNPMVPGPAYIPQSAPLDPWADMRMPGQGEAQMPGYGAAPGQAQGQRQGGLFGALFGGGNGLAKMLIDSGMGTGGLLGVPSAPMSPEAIAALRKSPDYSAEQIKALEQNKAMYSPKAGAFAPTKAPGGKARRTYGDSSATGSGGSLVGR